MSRCTMASKLIRRNLLKRQFITVNVESVILKNDFPSIDGERTPRSSLFFQAVVGFFFARGISARFLRTRDRLIKHNKRL